MKILKNIVTLFFILTSTYAHALIEEKKYWLAMNVQQNLDVEKKWLASFYSQWRLF